jgi:hypothetical protein
VSDLLDDVKVNYTRLELKLKFYDPKYKKKVKRTLEKLCTFELAYPHSAILKIAEKWGTVVDGLKEIDDAVKSIIDNQVSAKALDTILFYIWTADSFPMIGEEFEEIELADLGSMEIEELPNVIRAIYTAIAKAFPKKKATGGLAKELAKESLEP